jgi:hypothetical protein
MSDQLPPAKPAGPLRSNARLNTDLKLQLSNSYPADFDQLAQLLHAACTDERGRIPVSDLAERLGLAARQMENLGSIAQAFDLLQRVTYKPTLFGQLVHTHDPFFDDLGTLWYIHFTVSTDPRHVVWNRIITVILPARRSTTRDQVRADLNDLRQWFSEYSIQKHILKEVNTVLGAYTEQRLSRLVYLRSSGEGFALGYREPVPPLVLLASIAHYRDVHHAGATAISLPELITAPNGPGVIFQLNEERLRSMLEDLKTQPGLTVESRADLDQVRLTESATADEWMRRYYEARHAPMSSSGGPEGEGHGA